MTDYPRLPPSGITVIIVGAGFAGLAAAIECDRKGHSVILLEKSASIEEIAGIGDIISFDPNGSCSFERWPGVVDAMVPICIKRDHWDIHHWQTGETVSRQSFADERPWGKRLNGHRGELHRIIYKHAVDRGLDIRLGHRVTEYFETVEHGGVVVNGERMTADLVVAAEGVRSRGRKVVLGFEDPPESSGYAVYRAWFDGEVISKNPKIKHLLAEGDTHQVWVGPDIHFLLCGLKDGREFNWVMTHLDDGNIEESWQFPGKPQDALKYIEDWDPVVREVIASTPPGRLIDHKLVYRKPLPTFISPNARLALIGDAAHPFLPTSIQGASQAIEDGVVLATCLELSGRADVPLAARAYEKLRFERVHKAQATGVEARDRWHNTDWEAVRERPDLIHIYRHPWILNFDAEADAYERYGEVVRGLNE
jgi:2-polyprenyl-6-methoxyphenol hydroxylase-like FAD-dependent oxidoreductase